MWRLTLSFAILAGLDALIHIGLWFKYTLAYPTDDVISLRTTQPMSILFCILTCIGISILTKKLKAIDF